MTGAISWILELKINAGEFDALKEVMTDMVAAAKSNEPGTTHYEWFANDEKTECHLYERYINSDAVLVHLKNFEEHFSERFLAIVEPTGLVVYGDPSSEARDALADFGAVLMSQIGGFAR